MYPCARYGDLGSRASYAQYEELNSQAHGLSESLVDDTENDTHAVDEAKEAAIIIGHPPGLVPVGDTERSPQDSGTDTYERLAVRIEVDN